MKILIADTYYPEAIKAIPFDPQSTYDNQLAAVLDAKFGTADFYSRNLRALGHECVDVIVNHPGLMAIRSFESQLEEFRPDVIFLQDASIALPPAARKAFLVGLQCSCPWPGDQNIRKAQVAFSSFPHYVPRIEALGVKAVYLPLAFEPSVLEGPQPERDIDISFVGGVGRDLHWRQGTDVLEAVAAAFPDRFQWWGYGLDRLSNNSPLRACYKGTAWGREMYSVYRRSKIVLNRTGEVAQGFGNNLRNYEATGSGALLITDNRTDLFAMADQSENPPEIVQYDSAQEAINLIGHFLKPKMESMRLQIAERGQRRTLRDHTYAKRMKVISEALTGMLCPA